MASDAFAGAPFTDRATPDRARGFARRALLCCVLTAPMTAFAAVDVGEPVERSWSRDDGSTVVFERRTLEGAEGGRGVHRRATVTDADGEVLRRGAQVRGRTADGDVVRAARGQRVTEDGETVRRHRAVRRDADGDVRGRRARTVRDADGNVTSRRVQRGTRRPGDGS